MREGFRPFRGLSLDLWFTTCWDDRLSDGAWDRIRLRSLWILLEAPDGGRLPEAAVRTERDALRAEWVRAGRPIETVDPADYVSALAQRLGGILPVGVEEATRRYSDAGLEQHPPQINPEAVALVYELARRGIPTVITTNTTRRGESWKSFLEPRLRTPVTAIVASCDVGSRKPEPAIFRESAARLGMDAPEVLHVGDRWELDVEGARRAGMGSALYRGLRHRYWSPTDISRERSLDDGNEDVLRIDDLRELLRPELWSQPD